VLYWALLRKRTLLLSLSILVLSYILLGSFFQIRTTTWTPKKEDLSVMSYNVRSFDKLQHLNDPNIYQEIKGLITSEDPDIISFQEFDYKKRDDFENYPHKFVNYIFRTEKRVVQAIFSKYPIVDRGTLDFPESSNNAIYADIKVYNDTIRVYNVHLQSFRVVPTATSISNEDSEKLLKRMYFAVRKQEEQARFLLKHQATNTFPKIVCGDLNTTQFSHTYRLVRGDMNDSFLEKGKGFGRTFNFKYFPLRIDYILADLEFEVQSHKNFDRILSDHLPVMASFKMISQ